MGPKANAAATSGRGRGGGRGGRGGGARGGARGSGNQAGGGDAVEVLTMPGTGTGPGDEFDTHPRYWTIPHLKIRMAQLGMRIPSRANKADLIALLRAENARLEALAAVPTAGGDDTVEGGAESEEEVGKSPSESEESVKEVRKTATPPALANEESSEDEGIEEGGTKRKESNEATDHSTTSETGKKSPKPPKTPSEHLGSDESSEESGGDGGDDVKTPASPKKGRKPASPQKAPSKPVDSDGSAEDEGREGEGSEGEGDGDEDGEDEDGEDEDGEDEDDEDEATPTPPQKRKTPVNSKKTTRKTTENDNSGDETNTPAPPKQGKKSGPKDGPVAARRRHRKFYWERMRRILYIMAKKRGCTGLKAMRDSKKRIIPALEQKDIEDPLPESDRSDSEGTIFPDKHNKRNRKFLSEIEANTLREWCTGKGLPTGQLREPMEHHLAQYKKDKREGKFVLKKTNEPKVKPKKTKTSKRPQQGGISLENDFSEEEEEGTQAIPGELFLFTFDKERLRNRPGKLLPPSLDQKWEISDAVLRPVEYLKAERPRDGKDDPTKPWPEESSGLEKEVQWHLQDRPSSKENYRLSGAANVYEADIKELQASKLAAAKAGGHAKATVRFGLFSEKGRHRSVAIIEYLAQRAHGLFGPGWEIKVRHLELQYERDTAMPAEEARWQPPLKPPQITFTHWPKAVPDEDAETLEVPPAGNSWPIWDRLLRTTRGIEEQYTTPSLREYPWGAKASSRSSNVPQLTQKEVDAAHDGILMNQLRGAKIESGEDWLKRTQLCLDTGHLFFHPDGWARTRSEFLYGPPTGGLCAWRPAPLDFGYGASDIEPDYELRKQDLFYVVLRGDDLPSFYFFRRPGEWDDPLQANPKSRYYEDVLRARISTLGRYLRQAQRMGRRIHDEKAGESETEYRKKIPRLAGKSTASTTGKNETLEQEMAAIARLLYWHGVPGAIERAKSYGPGNAEFLELGWRDEDKNYPKVPPVHEDDAVRPDSIARKVASLKFEPSAAQGGAVSPIRGDEPWTDDQDDALWPIIGRSRRGSTQEDQRRNAVTLSPSQLPRQRTRISSSVARTSNASPKSTGRVPPLRKSSSAGVSPQASGGQGDEGEVVVVEDDESTPSASGTSRKRRSRSNSQASSQSAKRRKSSSGSRVSQDNHEALEEGEINEEDETASSAGKPASRRKSSSASQASNRSSKSRKSSASNREPSQHSLDALFEDDEEGKGQGDEGTEEEIAPSTISGNQRKPSSASQISNRSSRSRKGSSSSTQSVQDPDTLQRSFEDDLSDIDREIQEMPHEELRQRYTSLVRRLEPEPDDGHFCFVCTASFEGADLESILEHYEEHRLDPQLPEADWENIWYEGPYGTTERVFYEPSGSGKGHKVTFAPYTVEKRVGYNDQPEDEDGDDDSPISPTRSSLKKAQGTSKETPKKRGRPRKLTLEPAPAASNGVKKPEKRAKKIDPTYKKSPTPSSGTPSPILRLVKRLPKDHPNAAFRIRRASLVTQSSETSPGLKKKKAKKAASKKTTKKTKDAEPTLVEPSTPSPPPVPAAKKTTKKAAPKETTKKATAPKKITEKTKASDSTLAEPSTPPVTTRKTPRKRKPLVTPSPPPTPTTPPPIKRGQRTTRAQTPETPTPAPRGRKRKAPEDEAFQADIVAFDSSSESAGPVAKKAKKAAPARKTTPAKKATPAKKTAPAKKTTPAKQAAPAKKANASKKTPVKPKVVAVAKKVAKSPTATKTKKTTAAKGSESLTVEVAERGKRQTSSVFLVPPNTPALRRGRRRSSYVGSEPPLDTEVLAEKIVEVAKEKKKGRKKIKE
ncbi:uncharacterized protein BDZ99DRAFT_567102 [Mytilinidion resinicola]|uniref:Uncharacterized protein n=1 Tax=Mytilinidion resinicola TaxID=574789 RepID=A0A6A6Z224_9PEZI|nr:uncharacterized protein BDZ99DRAFT_567102 [Mytilinidion resinicola]KAF2815222.1 hypothetical protein BDZ99DRAFT_567102 [Mytilinidion resinicola]